MEPVYRQTVTGRLPRVNEWHTLARIGKAPRIIKGPKYRRDVRDAAVQFKRAAFAPIDYPVDLVLEITTWKRLDSDACVKGILDAMEAAGVVTDDKLIRDIVIRREYHKRDAIDRCTASLYMTGADRIWT